MQTLVHSNTVAGLTILDDGTKIYWSESGSDSIIVTPDGTRTVIEPYAVHPYQEQIDAALTNMREMTADEETNFNIVMGQ